jgi:hypothetical protein
MDRITDKIQGLNDRVSKVLVQVQGIYITKELPDRLHLGI